MSMIRWEDYKPSEAVWKYPTKPSKPRVAEKKAPADYRTYANELETYEQQLAEYHVKVAEYHKMENEAAEKFFNAIFEDLGLINHPKKALLKDKAWEHGHASGYNEVANWMYDLAELIQ